MAQAPPRLNPVDLDKKFFTTGDTAVICHVAPRTVSKWFDSGKLKGYRIPGSQDRRIPREELYKFLLREGMPQAMKLAPKKSTIVAVGCDPLFVRAVGSSFPDTFVVEAFDCLFAAGGRLHSHPPVSAALIGLGQGRTAVASCQNGCTSLRVPYVLIAPAETTDAELLAHDSMALRLPADYGDLAALILRMIDAKNLAAVAEGRSK